MKAIAILLSVMIFLILALPFSIMFYTYNENNFIEFICGFILSFLLSYPIKDFYKWFMSHVK